MYKIIRFYSDGRQSRVMAKNYTLKQAQEHCQRDDTSSETHPKGRNGVSCEWFEGYTKQ